MTQLEFVEKIKELQKTPEGRAQLKAWYKKSMHKASKLKRIKKTHEQAVGK